MTQIDYEITTFYKAILHLFLALGALSPIPRRGGGLPKITVAPQTPLAAQILWATLPPHYKLGNNAVITLNKEIIRLHTQNFGGYFLSL